MEEPNQTQPPASPGQQPYPPPPPVPPATVVYGPPPVVHSPYPSPVAVAPKNPALCVLASFFLPGLGSLLCGSTTKGIVLLVCAFLSGLLMFVLIGLVTYPIVWILGMVFAYQDAQRWNLEHGILS